ncbi:nitrilase-related carbon-nitrogen hydrolase [Spirillospora sp. CA-294931]|uniref:nitrilase-related carbon-nitrogen hydrolase n=1 Tax=Spirillospora sp. CA-294931 TaxID=3240042 RepID=UPI003D8FDC3A
MSALRVALAQLAWTGDHRSMGDRLERAVREASGLGARLTAFAELCTTPYFCAEREGGRDQAYEPIPGGPTVRRMSALAEELGMVLVVPLAELGADDRRYNSAAVIDADGTLAGTYRKRHLPNGPGAWEQDRFHPGEGGPAVFPTVIGRVGVALCWDRFFLDTWEAVGRERARLTVVPIASGRRSPAPEATIVQTSMARSHSMFVATVNRVGAPDFPGGSYVAAPSGAVLGAFGSDHEELVVRDLDLREARRPS